MARTTPGNPPPTGPIPDVAGLPAAEAVAGLEKLGYVVTQTPAPAPAGFLLPNGLAPTPGIVWSIAPAVGTVSPDGKLSVNIQP